VADIRSGLQDVKKSPLQSQQEIVQLYIGRQEYIEMYYGVGGRLTHEAHPELATAITDQETRFHELMQLASGGEGVTAQQVRDKIAELEAQMDRTMELARKAGVPLNDATGGSASAGDVDDPDAVTGSAVAATPIQAPVSMPEIQQVIDELDRAQKAYHDGDASTALQGVEHAYLEGFEPLESRLAQSSVQRVEKLIHLSLRPRIARGAPVSQVDESFQAVRSALRAADRTVSTAGSTFWFGALNSLIIIVREGLEAVLLIAALLAYLSKVEGGAEHRPRIYAGMGVGVVATFVTWWVARTLIPVSGGNRELLEGATALVAVCVLIYVSNWIFQRTYIHDWKDFLRERLDSALTTGSALAMAALAFAAVYREGFETVLFYQALVFDVGTGAVLAGFIPGLVLISAVAVGIIRLGLKLPLKQVFAGTNAILIYLAVAFTGKGVYNLQEGGLFAPHPVGWVPDSGVLRLVFGVYPVAETLAAQALVVAVVAGTYVYYRRKSRAKIAEAKARKTEIQRRTASEAPA